jgi:2-dehydro-3-deoxyphosphogalactonate aldolase
MLREALSRCGLVAILRGIRPNEVVGVGEQLYSAGFRVLEVPLNSPDPIESIKKLRLALAMDCVVGAGTAYQAAQVENVREAGGQLIVMPHSDGAVVAAAMSARLDVLPGVATPTEAFAAFRAGATLLKFFPADHLGPTALKAWRSALPREVGLIPVGGIHPENLRTFLDAGAAGFGVGSTLYKPGMTAQDVALRGAEFIAAWRSARSQSMSRATL